VEIEREVETGTTIVEEIEITGSVLLTTGIIDKGGSSSEPEETTSTRPTSLYRSKDWNHLRRSFWMMYLNLVNSKNDPIFRKDKDEVKDFRKKHEISIRSSHT
jgi:hypothetical protein